MRTNLPGNERADKADFIRDSRGAEPSSAGEVWPSGRLTGERPQVVQAAGGEHDFIDEAVSAVAEGVSHDMAAFNPGDSVLDRHPHFADNLIDGLLNGVEFASFGFFLGWSVAQSGGS